MKKDKLFNLFVENQMFCPYCLTNEYFFIGGGSWSPDRCPIHKTSDEVILWKQMTVVQKKKAAIKMDQGWYVKFGTHYFNEEQRKLYEIE